MPATAPVKERSVLVDGTGMTRSGCTAVSAARAPRVRFSASVGALLILTTGVLSGCGAGSEEAATPEEIVTSWTAIACSDVPVRRVEDLEPSPDVLARAVCELDADGWTRDQRSQVIQVFSSEAALKTEIAGVDCDAGYLRIAGPNWLARTLVSEFATALQEEMDGALICAD